MEPKKAILMRVYLVYVVFALFGIAIIAQAVKIQFWEGDYWRQQSEMQIFSYRDIEAVRGNIFASDGSLLATSIPNYEIRMDMVTDALSKEYFEEKVDSLAMCLSDLFRDKTKNEYKRDLIRERNNKNRFYLIKRKVSYNQLKKLRKFPIFRLGQYKGGFIYIQKNVRQLPFQMLAARTIGYDLEGVAVGLEGAYGKELSGIGGKRLMQKIAGGVWMPVNDSNELEPEDGSDIVSTIDINIQDVAENALLTQLLKHNAAHGCVVLMEVETGHVKAIANLSRTASGDYAENYNYAIGASTEPGSTFKLPALIAAMEDGHVDLADSVDTENGSIRFYDRTLMDANGIGYGKVTAQKAFEVSTNVGIAKIIHGSYSKDPQKFVERLKKMNLHEPLGLQIAGEGLPKIKDVNDPTWSGVTLPWMSIGYEVRQTPLQILTFYNAVANNGKMVKPIFVKEVRKRGKVVKRFKSQVINESICSKKSLEKARAMLEGVVEKGTANNLRHASYKIAGKTGTAQIANEKYGYKGKLGHQASFVGYFPADNPKYSCIVVVNAPSNNVYYGNLVAGPIFKEIADKVYSTNLEIHKPLLPGEPLLAKSAIPYSKNGYYHDLNKIFSELKIKTEDKSQSNEWVRTSTGTDNVEFNGIKFPQGLTPNVLGMGLQDASYILENNGYIVRTVGRGTVKKQSVMPGERIVKGNIILLELA